VPRLRPLSDDEVGRAARSVFDEIAGPGGAIPPMTKTTPKPMTKTTPKQMTKPMTKAAEHPAIHRDIDQVLTTTRSVRRRMDFTRAVDRDMVEACLELALQAPSGANRQDWRFIALDDPQLRKSLADIYRRAFTAHYGERSAPSAAGRALPERVADSARYLAENMHRVPLIVIPYRLATAPRRRAGQASFWGSILPAAWSFMLAARSRGLVTSYTARGLDREKEIAEVLGIPFPDVTQAGLIAVAHPDSQSFRPARRLLVSDVLLWNRDE
jgi:nitroreductase